VVSPGYTDTDMVAAVSPEVMAQILKLVPAGRLAAPSEIARGAVFLADDEAGYINGITLAINGGKYLT
jgi:acetoacetyl-CoA reductase